MQEIEVGDEVLEFPDNWSDAQIRYAIRQSTLKPEFSAAKDTSALDAAMVGTGRTLDKMYAGTAGRLFNPNVAQEQKEKDRYYSELQQERPMATGVGQALPFLATAPLSGGLLAQMGIGGALGASQYSDNPLRQGILEGGMSGLGYGAGQGISRVAGAVGKSRGIPALTGEKARLAARADDLKITIPPGQRLDSLPYKQLEMSMKRLPPTSGVFERALKSNQAILNKLAAKSIGESGEEISGDMFAAAADRIGAVYKGIAQGVDSVPIKNVSKYMDDLSVDSTKYIDNYFKRFPNLENGVLKGDEYIRLRTIVKKDIKNAVRNNPGVMDDLKDFMEILNKGLAEAAPEQKDILRTAGRQWKYLRALEQGSSVTKGNVNPRSLATQLKKADKGGFQRNRIKGPHAKNQDLADFYDAVRLSNEFGDIYGNSGTGTTNWLGFMMQDPALAPAKALAMNQLAKQYLKTGGSPVVAGLLGAIPASPHAGAVGAAGARGLLGNQYRQ